MLVKGRNCLVVGGGLVAARKAAALLEAGAKVLLVAPETCAEANALCSNAAMKLEQRPYQPEDLVARPFLVFTVTNDPAVNRGILEACHAAGILCACPDRGWEDGDMISPASFNHDGLTVSISTGGASCRRARMLKESLKGRAAAFEHANLLVLGTDQRLVSLETREQLHLTPERMEVVAAELRQLVGLHEFILLATCNRLELVAVATVDPALLSVAAKVLGLDRVEGQYYQHVDYEAFQHLAYLSAGLLSQTLGETHVRAQVKEALVWGQQFGCAGAVLHDWVGRSLRIGNAVRGATEDLMTGTEIEDRCVAFLQHELGDLHQRRILVVGTGHIGGTVIRHLVDAGATVQACYHRRSPAPVEAGGASVQFHPMRELMSLVEEQDALVFATSSVTPLLTVLHAPALTHAKPRLIVDLGMPRNVDPEFSEAAPSIRVVTMDTIDHWDSQHGARREAAIQCGAEVVERHREDYERLISGI